MIIQERKHIKEKKIIIYSDLEREKLFENMEKDLEREMPDPNLFFLKNMITQQPLTNTAFPCCATFFFYNWKVAQVNGSEVEWLGLSEHATKRPMQIAKAISAIANVGGGIILAGV